MFGILGHIKQTLNQSLLWLLSRLFQASEYQAGENENADKRGKNKTRHVRKTLRICFNHVVLLNYFQIVDTLGIC